MSEGSLTAPIRHPLNWQEPDFLDEKKLDEEMRRVFDICHGCRRCFNFVTHSRASSTSSTIRRPRKWMA
jgi:hypothetical protein